MTRILITALILIYSTISGFADRPMIICDADVVSHKHYEIEFGTQFDFLDRKYLPITAVNSIELTVNYGIIRNAELFFQVPAEIRFFSFSEHRTREFVYTDFSFGGKRVWRSDDNNVGVGIKGKYNYPYNKSIKNSCISLSIIYERHIGTISGRSMIGTTLPVSSDEYAVIKGGIGAKTPISESSFVTTEIYSKYPLTRESSLVPVGIQIGGGYEISSGIIVDAGILAGLNRKLPLPGIILGSTVEL